jgi:hypothetical protein
MLSAKIKRQRLVNLSATALFALSGVFMTGFAAFLLVSPVEVDFEQAAYSDRLMSHCETVLDDTPFSAERVQERLIVDHYDLSNPFALIAQTSVATKQCQGMELVDFCMGEACERAPLAFSLELIQE